MNEPRDIEAAFLRARELHSQGQLAEAEQAYKQLEKPGEHRKFVLEALAELYLQSGRPVEAADALTELTLELPDNLPCYVRLTGLLDGLGQTETAIRHYERFLSRQPKHPAAHYNVALLHKKMKSYSDALAAYEHAIRLGIDQVQEVYSNMGVVYAEMHRADKAKEMYQLALDEASDYIPALFNMASLFEEEGNREVAIELYQRILSIDPNHWDSLARVAYATKFNEESHELLGRLESAVTESTEDLLGQEGLYFALGKAYDEMGRFDDAFGAYRAANVLGKRRSPAYERKVTESAFDQIISLFDANWIAETRTDSPGSPIFICGMFRSGSTLLEQILGSHPVVTAGGESDMLPWLVGNRLAPFPQGVRNASVEKLRSVADQYMSKMRELFPEHDKLTDKRPDNFLHLGLIKVLFPLAKIVYTKRASMDNRLSIYFQQFGGNVHYSTDFENIAHYQRQHERLMDHWSGCFGDDICTIDYDELVRSPEPELRRLVEYLGLTWDDQLLAFEETKRLVKTASVWQVREGLHSLSSGRWKNYEAIIQSSPLRLDGD